MPGSASPNHRIRVLLVDSNADFGSALDSFLRHRSSGRVSLVGNVVRGEDALFQARDLRPEIVLLDLNLPGQPALEVIPRLKVELPQVQVIVLTLYDQAIYREKSLQAGADAFVSKGALCADLLPAIQRVAGSQ